MSITKIAIFGTGKRGKEILGIIQYCFHIAEIIFIDNFCKEEYLNGVRVYNAQEFLKKEIAYEYTYIIGGRFMKEMLEQLLSSEIQRESIYALEVFIEKFYEPQTQETDILQKTYKELVVLDCSDGFVLGGVECWSYLLARELKSRKIDILLYTNSLNHKPPVEFRDDVLYVPLEHDFSNINIQLQNIKKQISKYSKVTFVISHIALYLSVAILVKKISMFSSFQIVSVIHSSLQEVIRENIYTEGCIDKFICVNGEVYKSLLKIDNMKNKVFYKATPVQINPLYREYTENCQENLKIGYAARLEKIHKRSDLLCKLLEELEERNCSYFLDIAGVGECYEMIHTYVEKNNLQKKVRLLGRLDYSKMSTFWKEHDIAVSLSETEGCSLSMLESMALGVANVATHTVGCDEFIKDGQNGFLVPIGNIEMMAEKICEIEKQRELLPQMGTAAYLTIKEKCSVESYIAFWRNNIL